MTNLKNRTLDTGFRLASGVKTRTKSDSSTEEFNPLINLRKCLQQNAHHNPLF